MTLSTWWTSPRRAAALVLATAAAMRGLHLWLSAGSPFFAEPVVDALTYHDLARDLAAGGPVTDRLLWQAPLYPLTLAGLYQVVGASVVAARLLGVVVGSLTALTTWALGRRILGPGAGLAAGLTVAAHGVLLAFDTELLATGLATLWMVLGVWLLVRLADGSHRRDAVVLGLVLAAALLTRTMVALALLGSLAWLAWQARRWRGAGLALAAAVVSLTPIALVMHRHTGHAGLWPPSGAVNLYLGNSADIDETLTIRPGLPWEALIAAPVRDTGVDDPWRSAAWFGERTGAFVRQRPGRALANLGHKALHLLSSRELPRNVDIMVLRTWSPVLAATLWRAGPWGFPTGLLLPLAVVGFWLARRRVPAVVPLTALAYALGLVLVFTSARYRAPLWPLAAVGAVAGVQALLRHRDRRRLAVAGVVLGVLVVAGTVPGPFAQERLDLRAEMWHGVGFNQLQRGELPRAEASFRQALDLRDDYPEAWNRLGVALARQERYMESIPCFERAAVLAPDYPDPAPNLDLARREAADQEFRRGHGLQQAGDDAGAAAAYRRALAHRPRWAEPRARLALILATTAVDSLHDPAQAVALARQALADHGASHPWLEEVLATAREAAASQDR